MGLTKEVASGAVVYRLINGQPEYLLLKSATSDFWGFPKGHVEVGEDLLTTAKREIKEETNLDVSINSEFSVTTNYLLPNGKDKEVTIYTSQVDPTTKVQKQDVEISEFIWLPYSEAHQKLTFDNLKSILKKADTFIMHGL